MFTVSPGWCLLSERREQLLDRPDLLARDRGQHIAGKDPHVGRGAARGDCVHGYARASHVQPAGDLRRELAGLQAEAGMPCAAVLEQLLGHPGCGAGGIAKPTATAPCCGGT